MEYSILEKYLGSRKFSYALLIIGSFVIFIATYIIPLGHPDAGYEYHGFLEFSQSGKFEDGPFLSKLIYYLLNFIFTINGLEFQMINAFFTIIALISYYHLLIDNFEDRFMININLLVLVLFSHLILWSSYSAKHYSLFLIFVIYQIFFLIRSIRFQSILYGIFSSVCYFFALLTHIITTAYLITPAIFFFILVLVDKKRYLRKEYLAPILSFYVFSLFSVFPYLIYRISLSGSQFLNYPINWGIVKYGKIMNIYLWNTPEQYSFQYYYLIGLLFTLTLHIPLVVPFIVLGLKNMYNDISDKSSKKTLFSLAIVSWIISTSVPYILSRMPISKHYFIIFIFPLSFIITQGLIKIERYFKISTIRFYGIFVASLIIAILPYSLFTLNLEYELFQLGFVIISTGALIILGMAITVRRTKSATIKALGSNKKIIFVMTIVYLLIFSQAMNFLYTLNINNAYDEYNAELFEFEGSNEIENTNILARSMRNQPLLEQSFFIQMTRDLDENEAITILNWTSETEVVKIFNKYEISYFILNANNKTENDYYYWFTFLYGYNTKHYQALNSSQSFSQVFLGKYILVYFYQFF